MSDTAQQDKHDHIRRLLKYAADYDDEAAECEMRAAYCRARAMELRAKAELETGDRLIVTTTMGPDQC